MGCFAAFYSQQGLAGAQHRPSPRADSPFFLTSYPAAWCLPSGERKDGSVLVLVQWSCFEQKNCSNGPPELNTSHLAKAPGLCLSE